MPALKPDQALRHRYTCTSISYIGYISSFGASLDSYTTSAAPWSNSASTSHIIYSPHIAYMLRASLQALELLGYTTNTRDTLYSASYHSDQNSLMGLPSCVIEYTAVCMYTFYFQPYACPVETMRNLTWSPGEGCCTASSRTCQSRMHGI